jgi:hypothetical protein
MPVDVRVMLEIPPEARIVIVVVPLKLTQARQP